MLTRARALYLLQIVAVFGMVVVVWKVFLKYPSGTASRFRYIYYRLEMLMRGKGNHSKQRDCTVNDNELSNVEPNLNFSRYSLPHNTTVHGTPFHMDESIVNLIRSTLTNETFERKPIKLGCAEMFPEIVHVTGASSNHFDEHRGNVKSFLTHYPGVKLIFYDLGLTASEVKQVLKQAGIEYRKFDFSRYPAHVKNLFNYAWKALIIQHLLAEFDGVMWFDSSIRFQRNMTHIKERMVRYKTGFQYYVGPSGHSIVAATHPRMMEYFPMERSGAVSDMFQAGAIIVLNTAEVQNNILKWMCVCVLNVDCISPSGSTLFCNFNFPREKFGGCHRYDQSLLSILVFNTYGYEKERYTLGKGEFLATIQGG